MSEWLISIVGVALLGVLLELVLPDGKTSKYVRGAFSLLMVFAIAAPLPALFKGDFTFSLDKDAIKLDSAYVSETYEEYSGRLEDALEERLLSLGVTASVDVRVREGKIDGVDVLVTAGDAEAAREEIALRLNLKKDRIVVRTSDGGRA